MKKYYFISGLPRSGSTLLSAILRQNPDIYADIASPVETITWETIEAITHSENKNLILEDQRKNLMYGIFDGFYKQIERPVIFDSSRSWTKRTNFIKNLFPYSKILCPVRDCVSIINSFENIFSKNSFEGNILLEDIEDVFLRSDSTFKGKIQNPLKYLMEGYALNPDMIHFIEYEDLCNEPEKSMREVYKFLDMPYYNHDFDHVTYSNEEYDKACNLKGLHTVRNKVEYKPPRIILPPEIVEEYGRRNIEFWRDMIDSSYGNDLKYN
ncbi:sulfotransferase [archaeon]|nr:sulfotransferase [archaeon]